MSWGTLANTFDPFNQLVASGNRTYLFTADDERIYALEWNGTFANSNEWWTLRDLSGRVLREYLSHGNVAGQWSWTKDYVYRNGALLASVAPDPIGTLHDTLDHLGSPRLITDATSSRIALHTYYPFGGEATSSAQDAEKLKFTGHERDANGAGMLDDLDYMHARYCSPGLGRFLSVDPANSSTRGQPQSWNRYAYTRNNPLKFVDPNGQDLVLASEGDAQAVRAILVDVIRRPSGRRTLEALAKRRDFTLTVKEGAISGNQEQMQKLVKDHVATIRFAETTPVETRTSEGSTVNGAKVVIDSSVLRFHPRDSSGTATASHELYHATDLAAGKSYDEVKQGDLPTSASGPAEGFGLSVLSEMPDMTPAEASEILNRWLAGSLTSSAEHK